VNDTIFAPATPFGGAIAIIRISGPEAFAAYDAVFSAKGDKKIPREMKFGRIMDGNDAVDEAMACFFKAPASYTGEDMAELYLHGGQAVARRTLALLSAKGLRPAEPGEFTRRAFLNGKLSLSRAEAVMDMINAVTERGAKSALEQLEGSVGRAVGALEEELLDLLAGVDAALDYPDELEEDTLSGVPQAVAEIICRLDALIASGAKGRFLREGATVAILGAPNAGKSSLFNAMLGRERAIVTPMPGTTRDTLEEALSIEGVPVRLVDTAGLREAADEAERIGVARAEHAAAGADVLVLAFDAAARLTEGDEALIEATKEKPRVAALCKGDLPAVLRADALNARGIETISVSSVTGEGLALLRRAIAERLIPEGESALVTNARHVDALLRARSFLAQIAPEDGADCAAVLLHTALAALGEITGRDVREDVIGRIFEKFCVGK
jgi:tRNA modification GTPase